MARPATPMTSLSTEHSVRLAPSNSFGTRLTKVARSRTKLTRERVRSRSSRCSRGGMQLGRTTPCARSSAIPWASLTSVLRPGTAWIGCALGEPDRKDARSHSADRLPAIPRACAPDRGTLACGQPVRQPQDVARRRATGPCLRQRVPRRVDRPSADHQQALLHSHPRAALKHDIPLGLSSSRVAVAARATTPEERDCDAARLSSSPTRSWSRSGHWQQLLVPAGVAVRLLLRLSTPRSDRPLRPPPPVSPSPIFRPAGEQVLMMTATNDAMIPYCHTSHRRT